MRTIDVVLSTMICTEKHFGHFSGISTLLLVAMVCAMDCPDSGWWM
jgi:hypothetical protein